MGRVFRGYPPTDNRFLEACAVIAFYFALTFISVAKFPYWPTRVALFFGTTFRMSALTSKVQRISFLVLCTGIAVVALTVVLYYSNGHYNFLRLLAGDNWANSWYRVWFFLGFFLSVTGLFGSFFYNFLLKRLLAWVSRSDA